MRRAVLPIRGYISRPDCSPVTDITVCLIATAVFSFELYICFFGPQKWRGAVVRWVEWLMVSWPNSTWSRFDVCQCGRDCVLWGRDAVVYLACACLAAVECALQFAKPYVDIASRALCYCGATSLPHIHVQYVCDATKIYVCQYSATEM